MSEDEFDKLVNKLKTLCFTVNSGYCYGEEFLQLDDVVDLLREELKVR